jgi:DNA repair exonuclease SbcCD ATPase subunit
MKNIQFEEVGMENYGPYIDPMILSFDNDKLTLVTGPNGIGKTMAIDAIPFTLYGVTSKGAKGDDVVNNTVGKNCKTWVKFKVNDDQYLVTRYHKYTKLQNTVIVNLNGVDIKQGHRETLPYIERAVCPQQAFMNALMFGQKVKDFFTDLIDSKKKEIFRKILDLEMFLVYYKCTDDELKAIGQESHNLRNQMQIKVGLINDAIKQIEILNNLKNQFYNDRETKVKERESALGNSIRLLNKWQKDLESLKKEDIDLESTITELATIKEKINSLCDDGQKEIRDLESKKDIKISELKNKAQTASSQVNELANEQLNDLTTARNVKREALSQTIDALKEDKHACEMQKGRHTGNIKSLQDRIIEIQTHVIDAEISECPLCKQSVNETTINLLHDKIGGYKEEITNANANIYEMDQAIQSLNAQMQNEVTKVEIDLKSLDSDMKALKRAKQDKLESISRKLTDTIQAVEIAANEEKQRITKEIDEKTKELVVREQELKQLRIVQESNIKNIKEAEDAIFRLTQEQSQIEREIKQLEETEYDETQLNSYLTKEIQLTREIKEAHQQVEKYNTLIEIAQFWKTGFSSAGIPSMLIDEAVPYMNERVEHYLDMLTNGRYIVSFDTLAETKAGEFRDKISVHVLDTQTRANTRVQLSGGQTRIIDIAIILTLGDLLSRIQNLSFNILLFDEIFDALDEQNIQYVSKVLSKIKIGKAIYVISHQHQDHLEADETLAFS